MSRHLDAIWVERMSQIADDPTLSVGEQLIKLRALGKLLDVDPAWLEQQLSAYLEYCKTLDWLSWPVKEVAQK